jgi:hypothetical protein
MAACGLRWAQWAKMLVLETVIGRTAGIDAFVAVRSGLDEPEHCIDASSYGGLGADWIFVCSLSRAPKGQAEAS